MTKSVHYRRSNVKEMAEQTKTTRRRSSARNSEEDALMQLGRVQPQAVDFEKAVLGACIIEQDAFGVVADFLKPHSFYEKKHQIIFQG